VALAVIGLIVGDERTEAGGAATAPDRAICRNSATPPMR
jgi:hypothetical protein